MNWESALGSCEALTLASQSDWRLPNIKELGSIVDTSERNPAIDETAFPNTISESYWSSSPIGSTNVHHLDFSLGRVLNENKSYGYWVRCVRGGQ